MLESQFIEATSCVLIIPPNEGPCVFRVIIIVDLLDILLQK